MIELSAPIYRLRRKARLVSREEKIPLHEALDRVAAEEGFSKWSLLASKLAAASPAAQLYSQLREGDFILIAARPGQGKTLLSLELAIEAMNAGNRSVFFSLEYTPDDCLACFRTIGQDLGNYEKLFEFDGSDDISADYIDKRLTSAQRGTVVIVDYLQLLDQRRDKPALADQVRSLKSLAAQRGLVMLFISQVDRSYDPVAKPFPTEADVRLPNHLDLKVFDKLCFLNDGQVSVSVKGRR